MSGNPLLELAEWAEAATEAKQFRVITEAALALWGWQDDRYKRVLQLCEIDGYESAAVTLVPEGHSWTVAHYLAPRATSRVGIEQAAASTPALALTAASLRARATLPARLGTGSGEG